MRSRAVLVVVGNVCSHALKASPCDRVRVWSGVFWVCFSNNINARPQQANESAVSGFDFTHRSYTSLRRIDGSEGPAFPLSAGIATVVGLATNPVSTWARLSVPLITASRLLHAPKVWMILPLRYLVAPEKRKESRIHAGYRGI